LRRIHRDKGGQQRRKKKKSKKRRRKERRKKVEATGQRKKGLDHPEGQKGKQRAILNESKKKKPPRGKKSSKK